jgi:glycosyltransferase involved in cell wall biosynthesis
MKILFVSRAYPPVTGGIENQNFGLAKSLSEITPTTIFANTRGKKFLPLWLPYAALRILLTFWKYDAILFGDGVLAPLGLPVKLLSRRTKVFSVIHGLDVTFMYKTGFLARVYKRINVPSLRMLDRLIMVGNQTIEEAVKAGVDRERCVFIPNGVFLEDLFEPHTREELGKVLGMDLQGKKVVLRIGRYVKHKGVEWFIRNVVPKLPENVVFVAAGSIVARATAGDGSYFPQCEKAVKELGFKDRVRLLTNLPQEHMNVLLNTADLVVSPNIRVPGSMEGFGINVIEAAACERVVVASDLDGLKDAVIEGKNGFLVEPGNTEAYIKKITELLRDDAYRQEFGRQARQFVMENFSWEKISREYVTIMQEARGAEAAPAAKLSE